MALRSLEEELLVLGHTPQLAAILDRPPLETDANFAPFFQPFGAADEKSDITVC